MLTGLGLLMYSRMAFFSYVVASLSSYVRRKIVLGSVLIFKDELNICSNCSLQNWIVPFFATIAKGLGEELMMFNRIFLELVFV